MNGVNNMEKNLSLQKLLPKQAHFCLSICHFLEKIQFQLHSKKCLIALSGGVDSMALFLFLLSLQKKYQLELMAIHIDHSLRESSKEEALYVEKICKDYNVECYSYSCDVYSYSKEIKKGIEETARIIRYKKFEKLRKEKNFDFIFLGHHLNDLAEDMLMRQIRGTSLEESLGMQAVDNSRKLVRPFLIFEKKELIDFVLSSQIEWIEDKSNQSDEFLRNRVRLSLLPLFIKENPSFLKTVKNNWLQNQIDKSYWQKKIYTYLLQEEHSSHKKEKNIFTLNRKLFCLEEKAIRLRILKEVIKEIKSHPQAEVLFQLEALITSSESNKKLHINKKIEVHIQKEYILFTKNEYRHN